MGRSARYAIESHLQNLLTYPLKWRDDLASETRRLWRLTIRHCCDEGCEGVAPEIGAEVADWLIDSQHLLQENLSLRTFVKVAELAIAFPTGWKKLAQITTFKRDQE